MNSMKHTPFASPALGDWDPWKAVPRGLQPLVELRYDASAPVADLRARCEALCSGKPFRLVSAPKAARAPTTPPTSRPDAAGPRDRETPEAILRRHWSSKFRDAPPESTLALFRQAVDEVAIEGGPG